jgi:hypothetical protein
MSPPDVCSRRHGDTGHEPDVTPAAVFLRGRLVPPEHTQRAEGLASVGPAVAVLERLLLIPVALRPA